MATTLVNRVHCITQSVAHTHNKEIANYRTSPTTLVKSGRGHLHFCSPNVAIEANPPEHVRSSPGALLCSDYSTNTKSAHTQTVESLHTCTWCQFGLLLRMCRLRLAPKLIFVCYSCIYIMCLLIMVGGDV